MRKQFNQKQDDREFAMAFIAVMIIMPLGLFFRPHIELWVASGLALISIAAFKVIYHSTR